MADLALIDSLAAVSPIIFSSTAVLLVIGLFAITLSSYVKIATVLGVVRVGMGIGSFPGIFITGSLAFFLSLFIMFPTLEASINAAHQVVKRESLPPEQVRVKAFVAGARVWGKFLHTHAEPEERVRFEQLARKLKFQDAQAENIPGETDSESFQVLAPAFIVSELKEAFATGLHIFLPFLVVELIVANLLVAVGLIQLNPTLVSFPFKLLLFVMADGWTLITGNLVLSYT